MLGVLVEGYVGVGYVGEVVVTSAVGGLLICDGIGNAVYVAGSGSIKYLWYLELIQYAILPFNDQYIE